MRRLEVRFRESAQTDLDDIFQFVLAQSLSIAVADRFTDRLIGACERIGDAPLGGRPRDDLEPGLRTSSFERRAVIAYKVLSDEVAITNIFYAGRDIAAFYRRAAPEMSKA
jgi:toxin ParE1/3/4